VGHGSALQISLLSNTLALAGQVHFAKAIAIIPDFQSVGSNTVHPSVIV
jgi:hypothetical protein